MLELNNFKVSHFTNGNDCLDAFNRNSFDICILDIMLPKMDGFELATLIRKKIQTFLSFFFPLKH